MMSENWDDGLEILLIQHGMFPSELEIEYCENIYEGLKHLVEIWVEMIRHQKKELSIHDAAQTTARLYECGSHYLEVRETGAEIDFVCWAPRNIERQDFFDGISKIFKDTDEIRNLTRFDEGYVPVLKMRYNGIPVSIAFSGVSDKEIENNQGGHNSSSDCFRSMNECRVGDVILKYVPDAEVFRVVLLAVKLWAQINGVYGERFGYLGGISWAILVAQICQDHPKVNANLLVCKFFETFSNWNWPSPITLNTVPENNANQSLEALTSYEKKIPILMPVEPYENTSRNCSSSCKNIIVKELQKAAKITDAINAGTAKWDELFKPHNFFEAYSQYVVLIVKANSEADQLVWSRYVETRLRKLPTTLKQKFPFITVMRLWPKSYHCENREHGHNTRAWFLGLECETGDDDNVTSDDLISVINQYVAQLKEQIRGKTEVGHRETTVRAHYVEKNDLLQFLTVFDLPIKTTVLLNKKKKKVFENDGDLE